MNEFGNRLKVRIFGASHEPRIGVELTGVPAGIDLCAYDFEEDLARRKAGCLPGTSPRVEPDVPVFESGVQDGKTTGCPLTIVFENTNTRSSDYESFKAIPRPGHADFSAMAKYGPDVDLRGGGQFSGRMTVAVVAAGVVAKKMLEGIVFDARLVEVGGCGNLLKWPAMVEQARAEGDSLGGVVECVIDNVPAGLGEPFWDSVESMLSHAVFAIPGVRGIEFGDGFAAARMKGSEHNDPFGPDGPVKNGSGGVNGGITNGAPIHFRVAFKPTSSIAKPQQTWDFENDCPSEISIKGRHDVCFALRTAPIVEAVSAIVLSQFMAR